LEGQGFTGCVETLPCCHPEPFAVILSAAKDLALPLRINYAKDLALSIFMAMRDSSFAMLRTACRSSE
jgi:hypothetical protein